MQTDQRSVSAQSFRTDKLVIALCLVASLVSCARSYVPPRSEVVEEAKSKGLELASPEQDRERFFQAEKAQQERLLTVLTERAKSRGVDQNYRIGANDEIEINVFDVPELNVQTKVRDSGFISLPLIGAVEATGKTEGELQEELRKRLSQFVRDPSVSIFISNYSSQNVAVLGAVGKPGTYPLKKGSNSVLELVSAAGGIGNNAGGYLTFIPSEVTGMTAGSDVEARAKLSIASYETGKFRDAGIEIAIDRVLGTGGGIPLELPVRGGDMIVVAEAGRVSVDGEVANRGMFDLGRRMTVLGALAAAGGITYGAKVDEVEVIRDLGGSEKAHIVIDLDKIARGTESDIRLRDGDVVIVPSHSGRRITQNTFEGLTRIINFGVGGQYNVGR